MNYIDLVYAMDVDDHIPQKYDNGQEFLQNNQLRICYEFLELFL